MPHPDEAPPPEPDPERDFETQVSDIGTDPNAVFDEDLNPIDFPDRDHPNPEPKDEPHSS